MSLMTWTWVISAAIVAIGFATAFAVRPKRKGTQLSTENLIVPDPYEGGYRDGGTVTPRRHVGRHPALDMSYGKQAPVRQKTISLTPRMLERMNYERRRRGAPPLNRAGIIAATAVASNTQRQPDTSTDWLTYLILYEVLFNDHQSSYCSGTGGVTIDPNQPFNGAGGAFSGAGASGDWMNAPVTASIAADLAKPADFGPIALGGAGRFDDSGGPAMAPTDPKYSAGDFVGGYGIVGGQGVVGGYDDGGGNGGGNKDPAPSAPDPAPSSYTDLGQQAATYTPDPSPSYSAPDPSPSSDSSVSSSSSSYDSGSSSSFDSGGSSGGGGGDGS